MIFFLSLAATSSKAQPVPDQARPASNDDGHSAVTDAAGDNQVKTKAYVDDPLAKLQKLVHELKTLAPASSQEKLNFILDRAGERCEDLLHRTPNLISREDVTTVVPRPADDFSLRPHVGIQRQSFEYLLMTHQTSNEGTEVREYRMANGHPASEPGVAVGPAFSEGFVSEWLHLLPANLYQSRFRYLGEQIIDSHHTFVLAFTQVPGMVQFPAQFRSGATSVPILFQGVVWIDTSDFRIVRMREDLLTPRPEVDLQEFSIQIRFAEAHIPEANSKLWLPRDVDIDWYANGTTIHRSHRYSRYRLYAATAKILPATP